MKLPLAVRTAGAVIALSVSATCVFAAQPLLFPQPLHLTRAIDDPNGKTATVDEYCRGNVVVSISGNRTVIADYEKQTLTEIDRTAGTYSVTPFAQLAAIAPNARAAAAPADAWNVRATGPRAAHAGAEYYEAEATTKRTAVRKAETGVDRSVKLSRDAAEVLAGAAYPFARTAESDVLLRATAPDPASHRVQANAAADASSYGLAVDQTLTYEFEGRTVVTHNRVTRVGREEAPAEAIAIPAGARLVESPVVQMQRALDEADKLPATPSHH
jgi:hypothetical protein